MKNIAFIGIGVMGKSMARNLMKNGYLISIYSRTKSKALDIISEGAIWHDTISECVKGKDAVITMVGFPKDVEEVYFGSEGIIENVNPGTYIIDMTTTSPKLSEKIYDAAKEKGVFAIDAPVSGGDIGAKNGTLAIMAGGDEEAFEKCMELFNCMGSTIIYEGNAGAGQHTKMANQIAVAANIAGVCEAIAYGKSAGLDIDKMLSTISTGAAGSWQMTNMAPRIVKGDLDPGFFIKHFIKDMNIAVEESEAFGVNLQILKDVLSMYHHLSYEGYENLGTQGLIKNYTKEEI